MMPILESWQVWQAWILLWATRHWFWVIGGFTGLMTLSIALRVWLSHIPAPTSEGYGSSSWATMVPKGLTQGSGVILGQWGSTYLRASGEAHVLLAGPTRSGKGGVIIPTLLTWPYSVVVLDIKGEDYDLSSGYRVAPHPQGLGQRVYRYNPRDPQGDHINLMDLIRWRTIHEVADIDQLATSLAEPEAPPDQGTIYWQHQDTSLLQLILLYLGHQRDYPCSLPGAYQMMTDPTVSMAQLLGRMGQCGHPKVQVRLQQFSRKTPTKRQEVWDGTTLLLSPWDEPMVAVVSDRMDIPFDALQHGSDAISVYLQVTAADLLGRLKPVFRVTMEQLFAYLQDRRVMDYDHPVLLILDEFANMGHLKMAESLLSLAAGYGIYVLVVVQSLNQLFATYGERTSIPGNCQVTVLYAPAPNDRQSAELYSVIVGPATVHDTSTRVGGSRWGIIWKQRGQVVAPHERSLMTPAEVLRMGKETALILVEDHPPILGRKIRYWRDRAFKTRLYPSA